MPGVAHTSGKRSSPEVAHSVKRSSPEVAHSVFEVVD